MKLFHALIAALAITAACSSQNAYTGPVHRAEPMISREVRTSFDLGGRPRTTTIFEFTNPSDNPISVDIECDNALIPDVRIPARTTQDFLAPKGAKWCDLASWSLSN
jgi:hypothetical protein